MEVRVHLHSERPAEKNWRLLVSKEPHCLQQLIDDTKHGKLHGKLGGRCWRITRKFGADRSRGGLKIRLEAAERAGCAIFCTVLLKIASGKNPGPDFGGVSKIHADFCRRELWRRIGTRSIQHSPVAAAVFFRGGALTSRRYESGVRVHGMHGPFSSPSSSMRGRLILQDVFHINVGGRFSWRM